MDLKQRLQRRTLLSAAIIFTLLLACLAWWTLIDTRSEIEATRSLVRATVQAVLKAQTDRGGEIAPGEPLRHVTIELAQAGKALTGDSAGRSWIDRWVGTETHAIELSSNQVLLVKPNARSELIEHLFFSLTAFGALLLLGLVVAITQYRTLMHAFAPVQALKTQLESFERGDLSARLPVPELTELAVIANTFNRLADSLQRLVGEQRRLSLSLMSLRTEERHRLARELHDDLGQLLTAISVNVASLKRQRDDTEGHRNALLELERDVQQLRDATRAMLAQLREGHDGPLPQSQTPIALIRDWQQRFAQVHWRIPDDLGERFERLRVGEYEVAKRIMQEALTNIFKHSQASEIRIELRFDADRAECLLVENDGLSGEHRAQASQLGLIGMRERAASIGAQIHAGPVRPTGADQLPISQRWQVELRFASLNATAHPAP